MSNSIGQKIADQLALPSFKDISNGVARVYTDGEENFSEIGRKINDTKNKTFDTLVFFGVMAFAVVGGSVVLYGDFIFDAGLALANRIREHGVKVGFEI